VSLIENWYNPNKLFSLNKDFYLFIYLLFIYHVTSQIEHGDDVMSTVDVLWVVALAFTDSIEVITDNVNGLMYVSEKYMLDVIKNECKKFLTAHINEDYACVVLQIAHTFHLEDLQKDALQFIFYHGLPCLESLSFLSLSSGCVKLIIESEKLLCTEDIVYKKMIQWAEQQCRKEQHVNANKEQHVTANKEQYMTGNEEQHVTADDEQLRKVMGDLIYLIRFPIMKHKYFTNKVSTKNVLTLEEKVEIYQSFDGKVIDTFPTNARLINSTLDIWRYESYFNNTI